jgi:hypothetical protein
MTASLVIVRLIFYSSPICRAASTSELCVPTQWSLRRSFVVVKAVKSQDLLAPGAMNAICRNAGASAHVLDQRKKTGQKCSTPVQLPESR